MLDKGCIHNFLEFYFFFSSTTYRFAHIYTFSMDVVNVNKVFLEGFFSDCAGSSDSCFDMLALFGKNPGVFMK